MQIGRIEGTTRVFGKSQGYLGLPVKDSVEDDGTPVMVSAWFPGPKDIEKLKDGAPIYLHVCGHGHPPVRLTVGPSPCASQDTVDA